MRKHLCHFCIVTTPYVILLLLIHQISLVGNNFSLEAHVVAWKFSNILFVYFSGKERIYKKKLLFFISNYKKEGIFSLDSCLIRFLQRIHCVRCFLYILSPNKERMKTNIVSETPRQTFSF